MSSVPTSVPVRHGLCRLTLTIDDVHYNIRRYKAPARGARVWRLRRSDGVRTSALYSVVSHKGQISCTCPDDHRNQAVCKHVRALQACKLVNPRAVPSAIYVAATFAQSGAQMEGGAL
jgi:hypothetical protein